MRFWILAENTAVESRFGCEHGWSVLAECQGHKILFDMGKTDLFLQNACKMGLDLSQVETGVLSHGHYDHAGGLPAFFSENKTAPVWIQEGAEAPHYSIRDTGPVYIGVPKEVLGNERFRIIMGSRDLGNGALLLPHPNAKKLWPRSNQVLRIKQENEFVADDFSHEQYLVLEENGKQVLLCGCAHCGIVNIMELVGQETGRFPDVVIGGFHLSIPHSGQSEPSETIQKVGEILKKYPSVYYTGHCTGNMAWNQLRGILGDRIQLVASGMSWDI